MIINTINFYRCYLYFHNNGKLNECKIFNNISIINHIFTLNLIYKLWDKKHYTSESFGTNMKQNLQNISLPFTGICIKLFMINKYVYLFSILVIYPMFIFIYSIVNYLYNRVNIIKTYNKQLLCSDSWFCIWRINSTLIQYFYTKTLSTNLKYENKKLFLLEANKLNIPISPYKIDDYIIKNINIEGGLGIKLYKNAFNNGEWIIQKKLTNNDFISSLLPDNAPLSTIRVVTLYDKEYDCYYTLSAVFRAGINNSITDHNSILYNINIDTGEIEDGVSNNYWYKIGFKNIFDKTVFKNRRYDKIKDQVINNIQEIKIICEIAHKEIIPDIPIAGWDVALTKEEGICLLEVNLSCNLYLSIPCDNSKSQLIKTIE